MIRFMGARFAGRCPVCRERFPAGEYIAYDTGRRKAMHAECYREPDRVMVGADDDGDREADARERRFMDAEYAKGVARAEHIRDTARFFGEEAAMAEELAWELKDPDPYY